MGCPWFAAHVVACAAAGARQPGDAGPHGCVCPAAPAQLSQEAVRVVYPRSSRQGSLQAWRLFPGGMGRGWPLEQLGSCSNTVVAASALDGSCSHACNNKIHYFAHYFKRDMSPRLAFCFVRHRLRVAILPTPAVLLRCSRKGVHADILTPCVRETVLPVLLPQRCRAARACTC